MMGVIISSAVLPATLTLVWSRQNKWAASLSPILGLICALIAWLVTAQKQCGSLSVDCTGSNNPMLAGNVVALLSPLVFIPILTLFGWVGLPFSSYPKPLISSNARVDARLTVTAGEI
jgi:urea-proton symporter